MIMKVSYPGRKVKIAAEPILTKHLAIY